MRWIWIAALMGLALGCGRYGAPIRPEPKPAPSSTPSDAGEASEQVPDLGQPDFRLNLPGITGSEEDE